MIITHIGGPTAIVEIGGWRLLTDPTFDPAGGHYAFGWGTSSDKVTGPAVAADALGAVDAVLLTHDQHGDNLDAAGRALLPSVPVVVTTTAAARRLGHADPRGLAPGATAVLEGDGRERVEITATPARHGPPLSRPIVGEVAGFLVRCAGEIAWVTGDTVLYGGLRRALAGVDIDVMLLHAGGVRFPITGPLRYTMTGARAVELLSVVRPRVAVPVHYEGWSHFRDGRAGLEAALAAAPADVRSRVRWLVPGDPTAL
ncbi:L-ascorbate metabolism protein UlaG (beta-lactamase superfamily) [Nocardioides thalensis]|uniref:L-ascorbate metabolism protein UlaG (Beta-lactamase superfamily) n=1 Tax=Nocardioides thalensis TaxID=1914755 RepID=A0A853CAN8_9ACTN|nr:L-ascorbate metabolism protein UlaG (beta-lactamase superfamily) [Nocardioides thalensis]